MQAHLFQLPSPLQEEETESRDLHTARNSDTCYHTWEALTLRAKVKDMDTRLFLIFFFGLTFQKENSEGCCWLIPSLKEKVYFSKGPLFQRSPAPDSWVFPSWSNPEYLMMPHKGILVNRMRASAVNSLMWHGPFHLHIHIRTIFPNPTMSYRKLISQYVL